MAANYLHGAEVIEVTRGPRPIRQVKTAVIGLIGTAPIFEVEAAQASVDTPVLVTNDRDARLKFGAQRTGYTIPQALDAWSDHGAGICIVVNVFDPERHTVARPAEELVFAADDTIALDEEGIYFPVVKNQAGDTTYVEGADYILDQADGVITRVDGGAIAAAATVSVAYAYADPSLVSAADIIGTVDGGGDRTGLQALQDVYSLFGFHPKILIAPVYGTQTSVVTELDIMADKLRAIAYVDAPIGTTVSQAISGRGPAGAINFNTSSKRVGLCYPHVKVYDAATDADRLEPLSQRLAAVTCKTDLEDGYWFSPSNREIKGITGVERQITAGISDASSEANLLNEVGIITTRNAFGTGIRTNGNRSAAWPSVTDPINFISIRRTADVLHESVELSMLQFLDRPLNSALIEDVRGSVNSFIRTLIGRGALIDGSCTYDPDRNPPTELALGHVLFNIQFMPPPPTERITFESYINIELLRSLGGTTS